MGDMADDYEIQQADAARRSSAAMKRLVDWCSADFPYVCTGKKTVSADGRSVICECGNRAENKSEI